MSHAQALTSWDEDSIVFQHPHQPFVFKEIIHDILRTGFCVRGSVFLVERVELSIPVEYRGYKTVRLMLSDGHSCIQALFTGEGHGYAQSGQVYEGCYIRVDEFDLKIIELDPESAYAALEEVTDAAGRQARRRKPDEVDVVVYLLLKDFTTVGWDKAYMDILGMEENPSVPEPHALKTPKPVPDIVKLPERKQTIEKRSTTVDDKHTTISDQTEVALNAAFGQSVSGLSTNIASNTAQVPDMHQTVQYPKPTRSVKFANEPATTSRTTPATSSRPSTAPKPSKKKLSWIADDPSQPMNLTTLAGLKSLHQKANWAINVLAIVTSLSPVVVSNLKPFNECTAELADPSTDQRVKLTVFHHPETFTPRIGAVVLLPAVRNHTDGGLKRYYAEDDPEKWWFEELDEYGWCREEVERLKGWWDGRQR